MKNAVILSLILSAGVMLGCSKSGEKSVTSGKTPNTLQQSGLKGSVKMVETRTYEALMRFGEIEKGELTDVMDIYSSFTICAGHISEYNREGNVTKMTIKDDRDDIFQMYKMEYFQNYETGAFIYDQEGQLITSRKYIIENGKPVGLEYYNSSYHYDSILCMFDGFNPTKVIYYRDGKIEQEVENTYRNGLLASSASLQTQSGNGYYSEWTRNDAGMLTHYRFSNDQENLTVEDLTYDKGVITRYTRSSIWEGRIDFSMEYLAFDEHGNWIRRVILQNNQPLYLEERTIEYYQ